MRPKTNRNCNRCRPRPRQGIALNWQQKLAVIVADMSMETASATAEEINASRRHSQGLAVNIASRTR